MRKDKKLLGTSFRDIPNTFFAESEGFEPSIRLRVYRISSAALSTTQTTFHQTRLQRYCFFLKYANTTQFFFKKNIILRAFYLKYLMLR